MDKNELKKKLICIEYPGIVKNTDYMIQTLGGIKQLSQVFCNDKHRLQLKFRPNNVYSKPTLGDSKPTSGMLLKLKIRKRKNANNTEPPEILETHVVGSVSRIYKFTSMCDYQYLPIVQNADTKKAECIYDKCVPRGLFEPEWLCEDKKDTPYFLPPIAFSRIDNATGSVALFKKDQNKDAADMDNGLVGNRRIRRNKNAQYQSFNLTDEFPTEPHGTTEDILKLKFISQDDFDIVRKLFEKRPILSKMYILYESKLSKEKVKYILPTIAFHFISGPWRIMWARFGYDPRKHFESRCYQQMDFRIKMRLKEFVEIKRNQKTLKIDPPIIARKPSASLGGNIDTKLENYPYFEYNRVPTSRQCIYQYCDIRIPQIQEMLNKIPTPRAGATCNEKTGWLPAGFDDTCREIMLKILKDLLLNRNESTDMIDVSDGEEDMDIDDVIAVDESDYSDEDLDETNG